jgi:hypothetical protein
MNNFFDNQSTNLKIFGWTASAHVTSTPLKRQKHRLGSAIHVRQGVMQTRQSFPADTFASFRLLDAISDKQSESFYVNVVCLLQLSKRRLVGEGNAWHRRTGGQQPLRQTKHHPNTPLWGICSTKTQVRAAEITQNKGRHRSMTWISQKLRMGNALKS